MEMFIYVVHSKKYAKKWVTRLSVKVKTGLNITALQDAESE